MRPSTDCYPSTDLGPSFRMLISYPIHAIKIGISTHPQKSNNLESSISIHGMKYNRQIHHRRSIRLKEYDYGQPGAYFITICTHNKQCWFGEIHNSRMSLNQFGKIVTQEWLRTAEIRPEVVLDEWIIMPNHLHGIIAISRNFREKGTQVNDSQEKGRQVTDSQKNRARVEKKEQLEKRAHVGAPLRTKYITQSGGRPQSQQAKNLSLNRGYILGWAHIGAPLRVTNYCMDYFLLND